MKSNTNYKLEYSATRRATPFAAVCLNSCRNLLRQLTNIKQGLFRRFGSEATGNPSLLRAALNEAEALAWQTPYPHLFFPVLAEEKAVEVSRWAQRQQAVWTESHALQAAA